MVDKAAEQFGYKVVHKNTKMHSSQEENRAGGMCRFVMSLLWQ